MDQIRVLWQSIGFVPGDSKFEETEDQNAYVYIALGRYSIQQKLNSLAYKYFKLAADIT